MNLRQTVFPMARLALDDGTTASELAPAAARRKPTWRSRKTGLLRVLPACVVAIGLGTCGVLAGERQASALIDQPIDADVQRVNVPGTAYQVVLGGAQVVRTSMAPAPALVAAIEAWLTASFDLPKPDEPPFVAFVPPETMVSLRYRGFVSDRTGMLLSRGIGLPSGQPEVVAVYDDEVRTIYLPRGWSGRTGAELSVVVHEIVHHMQNSARLKYECPEAREKLAFDAQQEWLAMFGTDLETAFGIDPLTLLVRTNCLY